jgi:hypothetical protein
MAGSMNSKYKLVIILSSIFALIGFLMPWITASWGMSFGLQASGWGLMTSEFTIIKADANFVPIQGWLFIITLGMIGACILTSYTSIIKPKLHTHRKILILIIIEAVLGLLPIIFILIPINLPPLQTIEIGAWMTIVAFLLIIVGAVWGLIRNKTDIPADM